MKLSVLIPTHATKVEQIGPWKGMAQKNLCAPGTKLIETTMRAVSTALNHPDIELNFIAGLDHKPDDPLSVEYLNNLKKLDCKVVKVNITKDNALVSFINNKTKKLTIF